MVMEPRKEPKDLKKPPLPRPFVYSDGSTLPPASTEEDRIAKLEHQVEVPQADLDDELKRRQEENDQMRALIDARAQQIWDRIQILGVHRPTVVSDI